MNYLFFNLFILFSSHRGRNHLKSNIIAFEFIKEMNQLIIMIFIIYILIESHQYWARKKIVLGIFNTL